MKDLQQSITSLKGVGQKTARLYEGIGIYTLDDLLRYYPRTYIIYPEPSSSPEDMPADGKMAAFCGTLKNIPLVRRAKNMEITVANAYAGNFNCQLIWFRAPYMRSQVPVGQMRVFYGRVHRNGNRISLQQPAVYTLEDYATLKKAPQPVYALTKGITNTSVTKLMHQVLADTRDFPDEMPQWILDEHDLPSLSEAIRKVHFPDSFDDLIGARKRLVYDEFFFFILQSQIQKNSQLKQPNTITITDTSYYDLVKNHLPYDLTEGQNQCLLDIVSDLRGEYVSQRLIQGDVGSGKTIVAFLAMLLMVSNGYQAAIMAPTEVLARQHAKSFAEMCEHYQLPYQVVCLTGSMKRSEKKKAYAKIASENGLFIVGTHALIQEEVEYRSLGLVITDEQHRFGVRQRDTLAEKGTFPHVIVMSATPIPRTLAMILYGGMPISVIRDVPARRLPVKTAVIKEQQRETAYKFIQKEVQNGHQAYVICPLIEASEQMEGENVEDYAVKLRATFGESISVGALNGKMKPAEKNALMEDFAAGKIQVLVSTTVVEVGINVPNATVMLIENANRFGLAQLHQLRGRVGRGDAQSYCILVDTSNAKTISKRLEVVRNSRDGFDIAEEDLKMRGPGDFYGIRQSGEMDFALADVWQDSDMLMDASADVTTLLAQDPPLEKEEDLGIARRLAVMQSRMHTNL